MAENRVKMKLWGLVMMMMMMLMCHAAQPCTGHGGCESMEPHGFCAKDPSFNDEYYCRVITDCCRFRELSVDGACPLATTCRECISHGECSLPNEYCAMHNTHGGTQGYCQPLENCCRFEDEAAGGECPGAAQCVPCTFGGKACTDTGYCSKAPQATQEGVCLPRTQCAKYDDNIDGPETCPELAICPSNTAGNCAGNMDPSTYWAAGGFCIWDKKASACTTPKPCSSYTAAARAVEAAGGDTNQIASSCNANMDPLQSNATYPSSSTCQWTTPNCVPAARARGAEEMMENKEEDADRAGAEDLKKQKFQF